MTAFVRRPMGSPAWLAAVIGLVVLIPVLMFVVLLQPLTEDAKAELTALAWQRLGTLPMKRWMELLLPLLGLLGMGWFQWQRQRHSRLWLDKDRLHHRGGVPGLARWLDWSVPLQDLRERRYRWVMRRPPLNPDPLPFLRLQWGSVLAPRLLSPFDWVPEVPPALRDTPRAQDLPTARRWWPVTNRHGADQERLGTLPLVKVLRQHGVTLPPLDQASRSAAPGPDLASLRRLRQSFWALGVLTLGGFIGFVLIPHERIATAWPWPAWAALTALAGGWHIRWLWGERLPDDLSRAHRSELRVAQVLTGLLLAVSVVWASQAALMNIVKLREPAQTLTYLLAPGQAELHPGPQAVVAGAPVIATRLAPFLWADSAEGSEHVLTLRRAPAGLWWQLDLLPLLPERATSTRPAPSPSSLSVPRH